MSSEARPFFGEIGCLHQVNYDPIMATPVAEAAAVPAVK
jgi:hypothetical protein